MAELENRARFNLIDCSKKTLFLLATLWLFGCSHDPATVQVRELRSPPRKTSGEHIVRHGETLFSISWLYNRDYRELAKENNVNEPYTIYPGQTLSLAVSQRSQPVAVPPAKPAREVVQNAANEQKTNSNYSCTNCTTDQFVWLELAGKWSHNRWLFPEGSSQSGD